MMPEKSAYHVPSFEEYVDAGGSPELDRPCGHNCQDNESATDRVRDYIEDENITPQIAPDQQTGE